MQPLTPNERREVEALKDLIIKSWQSNSCHIAHWQEFDDDGNDELVMHVDSKNDKDLWLKVLSMALAQNDAIEAEWRKR